MSRAKGAQGEREVAALLRAAGIAARRDGRLAGDLDHDLDGWHFEIKRTERLKLPEWLRQAARDAPVGATPVVCFRQNRGEWYAALPLAALVRVLR